MTAFHGQGKENTLSGLLPLNGMKVKFNAGTTASVANVIDNSIHVIAYASNITGVAPTISYQSRLRFVG